jgi:hypothetical protein
LARAHIEFVDAFGLPEAEVVDGPFAGALGRRLSRDEETGAETALLQLDAGWSGELGGSRPTEIFVLGGALEIEGRAAVLAPGMHAFCPTGAGARLSARERTLALVMQDDEALAQAGEVTVVDPDELAWAPIGVEDGAPPGPVIKQLRVDAVNGDWTYLVSIPPGWQDIQGEAHPTVQEGLVLRGDLLMGRHGVMHPGCYYWRPAMIEHGPIFTYGGALCLFRTKGGSWEVTYQDVPDWREIIGRYKDSRPFFEEQTPN